LGGRSWGCDGSFWLLSDERWEADFAPLIIGPWLTRRARPDANNRMFSWKVFCGSWRTGSPCGRDLHEAFGELEQRLAAVSGRLEPERASGWRIFEAMVRRFPTSST